MKSERKNKLTVSGVVFPGLVIALSACSSTKEVKHTDTPTPVTQTTNTQSTTVENSFAAKNNASVYTELGFSTGSSELTADDQNALRNLVQSSMQNGKIDKLKIISWADREYPVGKRKNLPLDQQKLADRRNDAIKSYLSSYYPDLDVQAFNMAKKPNMVQELFKTSDARTKQAFLDSGTVSLDNNGVENPSITKASKSLILSVIKE